MKILSPQLLATEQIEEEGDSILCIEDGIKRWKNSSGKFHREDGPAYESQDGYKEYCNEGPPHREDGPAVIYPDGRERYFLRGIEYSKLQFQEELERRKVLKAKYDEALNLYERNLK